MARNLNSLARRMREVAERLETGLASYVGDVGVQIGERLVPATPVDTGLARANWRPSLRAPTTVPVTFLDRTGAATVARIRTVAQQYRLGDTLFIVNRVPYINRLNAGSSPQANAGFVQEAVGEGLRVARARFAARRRL